MSASDVELCYMSAWDLNRIIGAKQVSPVEVTQAVLERVQELDCHVHAFLTVTPELALKEAREAESRALRGRRLSCLDGIPYSIKDLIATAGVRTTYGSKWHEHDVPTSDASVAMRLRSSGGILIGKTNTPHFGHKDSCDNLLGPPCANPWDLERTAGGSSGGASAAVCAGFGPIAHGTDGAGSIRIPASFCGVVGFKPSAGLVPYFPKADYWARTATHGPIARTVRDAAMMLDVVAGYDPRDPLSIAQPSDGYLTGLGEPLPPLRVRWTEDFGYGIVDPEVAAICRKAVEALRDIGCKVEEAVPGWQNPSEFAWLLFRAAYARDVGELARRRPEWVEPTLMRIIEDGSRYSAVQYAEALAQRSQFYEQVLDSFSHFDLLVSPTMPLVAWPLDMISTAEGRQGPWEIAGRPLSAGLRRNYLVHPFSLTGFPAITVPCGFTHEGLPVGLQIAAGPQQDRLVLRVAAAYEQARPWAQEKPSLSLLAR
jgi:Asp-tRNA(Asn)/Glu-tRNA(Gln) amidotransferase A subunit family amidase